MIAMLGLMACMMQSPSDGYTVAGRVVNSVTGQPVPKAYVGLALTTSREKRNTVRTGADGRFTFQHVAAGKYTLSAERLGYMPQSYMQRKPGMALATALVVADGEPTTDILFRLTPPSAITGTVTNASRDPVSNVMVQTYLLTGPATRRRHIMVSREYTDDRGVYRAHTLRAGSYMLVFIPASERNRTPNTVVHAVTYFPGTARPDGAQTLTLRVGEELRADVTLQETATSTVRGTVAGAEPMKYARVTLRALSSSGLQVFTRHDDYVSNGKFTFEGVAPGRYVVNLWGEGSTVKCQKTLEVGAAGANVTLCDAPLAGVRIRPRIVGRLPYPDVAATITIASDDGNYALNRALQGQREIDFGPTPPGRYMVSATNRTHLAITAIDGAPRNYIEVPETGEPIYNLTVDAEATEVLGRFYRDNRPEAGMLVMLVPKSRIDDVSAYRSDQTDSDGSFTWSGVPAGEYLMFAIDHADHDEYTDPAAIRAILPKGRPLTVTGEPKQKVRFEVSSK